MVTYNVQVAVDAKHHLTDLLKYGWICKTTRNGLSRTEPRDDSEHTRRCTRFGRLRFGAE